MKKGDLVHVQFAPLTVHTKGQYPLGRLTAIITKELGDARLDDEMTTWFEVLVDGRSLVAHKDEIEAIDEAG